MFHVNEVRPVTWPHVTLPGAYFRISPAGTVQQDLKASCGAYKREFNPLKITANETAF
jgi:hypothetical protein